MTSTFRGPGEVRTIAVLGAGLIGAGWVAAFLARGLAVRVCDPAPNAEAKVRAHVAEAMSFHAEVEAAVQGADFVQENAPEREALKIELYGRLDAAAPPDVLIASSTSSFSVTQIQGACSRPQRCVMGYPFNPVHLIPLIEVGGGEQTDAAAVETALALYSHFGKRPIRLETEIFGHVANRLASAMFREAVNLVAQGVTTVEGVDDALRYGPALKWAIQGQFMTYFTSGGAGGMVEFLEKFGPGQERRWADLGAPSLTPELKARIVAQTDAVVDGRAPEEIAAAQDARLLKLLQVLAD